MIALKEFDKETLKKWKAILKYKQKKYTPEQYQMLLNDLKEWFGKRKAKDDTEGIVEGIEFYYEWIMEAKNEAKT